MDPRPQYDSCLYDACVLGPDSDAICDAYEQYAEMCRYHEQSIGDWRSALSQCREYMFSDLLYKTFFRCCSFRQRISTEEYMYTYERTYDITLNKELHRTDIMSSMNN